MKTVIDSKDDRFLIDTIEKEATVYFSVGNTYLNDLAAAKKSVIFWSDSFIFGIITDKNHIDLGALKKALVFIGNKEDLVETKINLR